MEKEDLTSARSRQRIVSNNPFVRQLANGQLNVNLYPMILDRELSLTDEEYLECLIIIRQQPEFSGKAEEMIHAIPSGVKETYAGKAEANNELVAFLLDEALLGESLTLVTRVIHNQFLPTELLEQIANRGNRQMLEHLIDNQIKLIAYPSLLTAIENNPQIDNFIRSRLTEIRSFYLEAESPGAQISVEEATEAVKELQSQQQTLQDELALEEEEEEPVRVDDALTTLQRINMLSTADRIKLALTGTKTERMLLIRDPNRMVALAVIDSPKIGLDEVATLVKNRSIAGEIISKVADNREWTKNYSICYELAINPKTPVNKAMGFIKKLREGDLRMIQRDRSVTPLIRQVAQNILLTKK